MRFKIAKVYRGKKVTFQTAKTGAISISDLLRRRGRLFDDADERDLRPAVDVVLVPAEDEGHGTDDLQVDLSRDDASVGGNLENSKTDV